jgi:hypothetical protein
MQLRIDEYSTIADLQQQFNSRFPYLKLYFTNKVISPGTPQVKKTMLPAETRMQQLTTHALPMDIAIDGKMTVSALENFFEEEAGLHAQVFRSSGSLWLITTATDQWSLDKQNSEGEELSRKTTVADEPQDIHEQE